MRRDRHRSARRAGQSARRSSRGWTPRATRSCRPRRSGPASWTRAATTARAAPCIASSRQPVRAESVIARPPTPPRPCPNFSPPDPRRVVTWDITRLPGPEKGIWYHAYVIIDIYSRYIVGHTVEVAETAERAEELIRETIDRNGIVPETAHADRGTSMTSKKVSQLLIDLGVTRSHSRPKVSNGNPFSESQFRTTKYSADYPERFDSLAHAREWMDAFIAY
ncbi:DDE-type integrase/transposase/recombinase [Streptomyces sp. NBC_01264]|uniref:DDE-type integrase/transposase/recombinase n=1 Tax=Streptomyces sp. NBC_01264 TaxID=2903804 RepID=UPI00225038FA|nr:DDE-type integrase/transposase/recombinase [Streptomyces sp. NBC_01264]MCX4775315.1 DDE-type integrase/transposase/recombinase [Streptomyces sp. NBC_01264]